MTVGAIGTEFAARLRWARKQRGLSQEELAGHACMTRTAVLRIETLQRHATADEISLLAEGVGCTVAALFGEEPLAVSSVYGPSE